MDISLILIGEKHPNSGKSFSAETCALISEVMKGIERSKEHKTKISVANGSTIYLYDSDGFLVNTLALLEKRLNFLIVAILR